MWSITAEGESDAEVFGNRGEEAAVRIAGPAEDGMGGQVECAGCGWTGGPDEEGTMHEYEIQGRYPGPHGWECVTTEDARKEAQKRLREYEGNEPGIPFRIRRVRVEATP